MTRSVIGRKRKGNGMIVHQQFSDVVYEAFLPKFEVRWRNVFICETDTPSMAWQIVDAWIFKYGKTEDQFTIREVKINPTCEVERTKVEREVG